MPLQNGGVLHIYLAVVVEVADQHILRLLLRRVEHHDRTCLDGAAQLAVCNGERCAADLIGVFAVSQIGGGVDRVVGVGNAHEHGALGASFL